MVRTAAAGGGMAEAEGLQDGGEAEGHGRRQEAAAAVAGAMAGVPGVGATGGHTVHRAGAAAGRGDGGGERGGKSVHVGLSPAEAPSPPSLSDAEAAGVATSLLFLPRNLRWP
jgi:hypothetical protein